MAQVVWTYRAAKDVVAIEAYIARDRPVAAARMAQRLRALAASLSDRPDRGRPVSGTVRELLAAPPYVMRYRTSGNTVYITRVRHAARRPAP